MGIKHSYNNPSTPRADLSKVEAGSDDDGFGFAGAKTIIDKDGWRQRAPVSDRECIRTCLHNSINLCGVEKNYVMINVYGKVTMGGVEQDIYLRIPKSGVVGVRLGLSIQNIINVSDKDADRKVDKLINDVIKMVNKIIPQIKTNRRTKLNAMSVHGFNASDPTGGKKPEFRVKNFIEFIHKLDKHLPNHNLDYEPITVGLFQKIVKKIELRSVQYLDLIIFSHKMRAKKFFKESKIKRNFITFYNSLPIDFYKKYKKKYSNNTTKKLFYFGSIGPGHGLFELIKSTRFIDKNICLEIYGWIVDENYYSKIYKFIKKNNLDNKIFIKLNVKDFEWKSKMMNADLGIALYETKSLSHKFMFPASQKINACLAACLPVLVSNTKDNKNFLANHKCGVSTNLSSKFIAKNINSIFRKEKFYKLLKKNSKQAFLNEFNFEKQFKKIKNQIKLN